mmetsp:Transcript_57140/g.133984  ORF Transcript_57140/g.133984 Transcript_57140/m.133984 type:complete len:321 (-) Transcript_57140:201-1163(-)
MPALQGGIHGPSGPSPLLVVRLLRRRPGYISGLYVVFRPIRLFDRNPHVDTFVSEELRIQRNPQPCFVGGHEPSTLPFHPGLRLVEGHPRILPSGLLCKDLVLHHLKLLRCTDHSGLLHPQHAPFVSAPTLLGNVIRPGGPAPRLVVGFSRGSPGDVADLNPILGAIEFQRRSPHVNAAIGEENCVALAAPSPCLFKGQKTTSLIFGPLLPAVKGLLLVMYLVHLNSHDLDWLPLVEGRCFNHPRSTLWICDRDWIHLLLGLHAMDLVTAKLVHLTVDGQLHTIEVIQLLLPALLDLVETMRTDLNALEAVKAPHARLIC